VVLVVARGGPVGLVAGLDVLDADGVAFLDLFSVRNIGLEGDGVDGVLGHCGRGREVVEMVVVEERKRTKGRKVFIPSARRELNFDMTRLYVLNSITTSSRRKNRFFRPIPLSKPVVPCTRAKMSDGLSP
jgi:hypothetical protein